MIAVGGHVDGDITAGIDPNSRNQYKDTSLHIYIYTYIYNIQSTVYTVHTLYYIYIYVSSPSTTYDL